MEKKLDPVLEKEVSRQFDFLKFGTTEITPEDEFRDMLRDSISKNQPLRVKCGIDPTSVDVHLGHTVPYRKMRQFQNLGHKGIVIIGDYTARIGDPTGRNEARPSLTQAQVEINAKKYMEQVYKVVDPNQTEVHFQSSWFDKVELQDIIKWAAQTTVAKLLGHETFAKRLELNQSLALHELFYPLLQGIDSVYINADVELGGSDQKFNVLMGRDYQKAQGQRQQVAMLLPIIRGTCGHQKMSKSLNNYIGILDDPFDQFGKTMSIPDSIMLEWYQYATGMTEMEFFAIKELLENGEIHPNEAKKQLAQKVVGLFHPEHVALEMRKKFESVFAKGNVPDDAPEFSVSKEQTVIDFLVSTALFQSNGEVRRLLKQNAVGFISGEKIVDEKQLIGPNDKGKVIKVGKRIFVKLI